MIDYRVLTFLELCKTMNYRITAENLNMTQPAVTQHIKFLEQEYNCKLFNYNKKKLEKTEKCLILEEYSKSLYYNHLNIIKKLGEKTEIFIRIGATKTIGEFVVNEKLKSLLHDKRYKFSFIIDNTENLLRDLEGNKLDFALIEGSFDKERYGYKLYKKEKFVGICSKSHRFLAKRLKLENLLSETLISREKGSGTRNILERLLEVQNFSIDSFKSHIDINNFGIIKDLVSSGEGIGFVYQSVIDRDERLGRFYLEGGEVLREFNYVYLKDTRALEYVEMFNSL